jgi:hypothetical protein
MVWALAVCGYVENFNRQLAIGNSQWPPIIGIVLYIRIFHIMAIGNGQFAISRQKGGSSIVRVVCLLSIVYCQLPIGFPGIYNIIDNYSRNGNQASIQGIFIMIKQENPNCNRDNNREWIQPHLKW